MILVTGGCGFVGSHVVAALGRRPGIGRVRVLDTQHANNQDEAAVEMVQGSVTDPAVVRRAVEGVHSVVHLAAKVDPHSADLNDLRAVNVEGTRIVLAAAVEARCALFLHLSSAGVYGHPRGDRPFLESDQPNPTTPYQRSKWEAEQVIKSADVASTVVNVLRPTGIYGPGSHLELPAYRKVATQRYVLELSGGVIVHPAYVGDVAAAICAMVEEPAPHGTVLNLGGERAVRTEDLYELVGQVMQVRRHRFRIPAGVASPAARVTARILAALGRPEPRLLLFSRGANLSAGVDDTAFRARYPNASVASLRQGVREHIYWARNEGLL